MPVFVAQEGGKYKLETDHQVKYIATALDSGEIHYPSYMVCFILFVLSLEASKRSGLVNNAKET